MKTLWYMIDHLREEMHVMALKKGISHPDVLVVSQRLDEAINKFYNVELTQKAG
ncbi:MULTISPECIES: aspartyl-phosphate phosphatase Spo0E family protein [Pelosinus]|uniref:Sporulation stage 0, Spo0E-like regulatory phosphatase n=1 Tax=Pelosinus fermentans B4 TaxID=1149862 RepID=I9LHN1_9FIRM|nr:MULTISPECIES: aspartyl-phosphate phosphatase Spo0E family protein [Pelosinus]EIW19881.1 Sporulation stage 0, Spo0E-like regulatory phosphatase [Pelosinus fermentans B4]EIW21262.1 Sporulation stage 0, Spo0E-like regulatory phosphatase [Pelosinus fermentans A11]OAM95036.1 Sporulation stage 0, Spo0E-like regulatory phosphatase [Pelosinus fermentans DSM 17108]SDR22334.1 Spo0E like sporulation regulatory protein [Pelosinus fermentans]